MCVVYVIPDQYFNAISRIYILWNILTFKYVARIGLLKLFCILMFNFLKQEAMGFTQN